MVLLPAPEGPKSTVTPGATSNATSMAKEPARSRSRTLSASEDTGEPRELPRRVEGDDGEEREDEDHPERLALAVRLDGVVDGERRGLRCPGDVARDHEGDAEVAE